MKTLKDPLKRLSSFCCCVAVLYLGLAVPLNGVAFDGIVEPSLIVSDCEPPPGADIRQLDSGMALERALEGGQVQLYRISVYEKQFVRVVVEQRGIDVELTMCAPNGTRVAKVDRPNGSHGVEAISFIAGQSGTFTLFVKSLQASSALARYQVRIGQQRNQETGDDRRIEAEKVLTEAEVKRASGGLDNLRAAVEKFELARTLWQSLNDPYEEALALYGLGWSHSEIGAHGMVKFPLPVHRLRWSYESRSEHQKAIDAFNRSLELMQQVGDRYGQALAQADRGWPELYLDQNEKALESFASAFSFFRETNNPRGEAKILYGIGWVHAIKGNHAEALNHFQMALPRRQVAKDRKGEAINLAAISRAQNHLGKHLEALDSGERALTLFTELKDTHGQASTTSILGWINYSLGRFEQALKFFDDSLVMRRAANDSTGEALCLYGMARVHYRQGNLQHALRQMQEVVGLVEPLRETGASADLRTYYFANVQDYYEFYIDLLMQLERVNHNKGYAEMALAAHERSRARELLAILAEAGDISPRTGAAFSRPLTAADIQQLIGDNTLLLEFALGEERSYLWAVSNEKVHAFELPKKSEIETRALKLNHLLTSRNQSRRGEKEQERRLRIEQEDRQFTEEARVLSRVLLSPILSMLGTKRLVIVAEGALQLIPFAALPKPSGTPAHRPLILDHEVVSLPSASVLSALRADVDGRAPAPKTLAVLADPVFTVDDPRVKKLAQTQAPRSRPSTATDLVRALGYAENADTLPRQGLRRLLGTRWEAQQIGSLLPENDRLVALDFAASRSQALSKELASYNIIHFATHALINDSDPSASTVALSQVDEQGRSQNGSLTLHDIYGLKLQAKLVVLSACKTGLGSDVRGEGIRGLAGGFMHAGVPSVIVSLWPVNDRVTAEFMFRLYRVMFSKKGQSVSTALREVQIQMINDGRWRAPYFWAPFVIQGEWK